MVFKTSDAISLDAELNDTTMKTGDLLRMCDDYDPNFSKMAKNRTIIGVEAHDVSDGKGFLSRVFKIRCKFDDDDDDKNDLGDYVVILKKPTLEKIQKMINDTKAKGVESDDIFAGFDEEDMQSTLRYLKLIHNSECEIYEIMRKGDLPAGVPIAAVYYSEKTDAPSGGLILMQDLSVRGTTLGFFYSATAEHCFAIARASADFQAFIEFNEDQSWRGRYTESYCTHKNQRKWNSMVQPSLKLGDEKIREYAKTYMKMDQQKVGLFTMQEYTDEFHANTLLHGDHHLNNIMFRIADDLSVTNQIEAIIDWQTIVEGNPLFDIARFITFSTDADVRRECDQKALDIYYDRLCENYAKHNKKPKFSREQATDFYQLASIQQCTMLIGMLTFFATPEPDCGVGTGKARAEKLLLRTRLLLEDCCPLAKKWRLEERCPLVEEE